MFKSQSQYLASSNVQSSSKNQADLVVNQSGKTRAEICFVLHAVKKNLFLRSCNENCLLYQKTVKCSPIAKLLNPTRWIEQNLVMLSILVLHINYTDF